MHQAPNKCSWMVQTERYLLDLKRPLYIHFETTFGLCRTLYGKGAIIFFRRGVLNLPKVGIDKTVTPLLQQHKFYDPPSWYTLPPKQAKIELKSVFLNKINTLWSSCDSLHFGHQIFYDPPIFLSKNLWPPVYLGLPHSIENDSSLKRLSKGTNFRTLYCCSLLCSESYQPIVMFDINVLCKGPREIHGLSNSSS